MKKTYLFVVVIATVLICLNVRCAKVNTDQFCGVYGANEALFRSNDNRCYYVDNTTGLKVYVNNSNCTCF